ncbi:MAG: methylmalonyl Co-A mutase-associated GTPase MeaB, partial [FCB group bacterium]|nr:methylmalonyl Co-A mutase-associated GTPase MeaB [FCB group bacterium]
MDIVEKIQSGDVRAAARLITKIEKRDPEAIEIIKEVYAKSGKSRLIGVTGPPGVGKSCLVAALVGKFRAKDMTVGVLAVDPSSPFSGGALLGDRARMSDHSSDSEVFIRSLASRGASGGLSAAVNDAADILNLFGKDIILIETVGVGQGEIDIARIAHTVLLVLMPGYGDTLQAMKAGIMEIADLFVVNKADKPGAEKTASELAGAHNFYCPSEAETIWAPPVVKTSATTKAGLDELVIEIFKHFQFLEDNNIITDKNRERRTKQFLDILSRQILDEFMAEMKTDPALQRWVKKIGDLQLDPYSASEQVIGWMK